MARKVTKIHTSSHPVAKNKILRPSSKNIAHAAQSLRKGGIVVFPTETVYGLAANAMNDDSVAKVFQIKKRPSFNPLIVHFRDTRSVKKFVRFNKYASILAKQFWPGSLTLVLPKKKNCKISLLASAGLDSLAVRVPESKIARELIKKSRLPIAAPSANVSGTISPTAAKHVLDNLPKNGIDIIDGGKCKIGIESTIIDLTGKNFRLLRPGGIEMHKIEEALKVKILSSKNRNQSKPKSPGQMKIHYAPKIPLRINIKRIDQSEALLSFGQHKHRTFKKELNLSPNGNLREAASNLFTMLHELDKKRFSSIAVMPIPKKGLGLAINDRLFRASKKRP
jgi:L-threonylcarbamoyladenylate synthase